MNLRYRILEQDLAYTGVELRTGWVRDRTALSGDAAAVFLGACCVPTEHLVDLDDRNAGETIVAARMVHFIVEHPGCAIEELVLRQRLLVCILCERLAEYGVDAVRKGDDVFVGGRKLTVSIAAPGPAAGMIHLGINLDPEGAPVAAVGLEELGVDACGLATRLMDAYADELATAAHAQTKVARVK